MPLSSSLANRNNSTPFTAVVIPESILKGKIPIKVANQTAAISNLAAFGNFLPTATYNEHFTVNVEGATNTFWEIIKAPVTFKKQIGLSGN